jgi:hypothetical protein
MSLGIYLKPTPKASTSSFTKVHQWYCPGDTSECRVICSDRFWLLNGESANKRIRWGLWYLIDGLRRWVMLCHVISSQTIISERGPEDGFRRNVRTNQVTRWPDNVRILHFLCDTKASYQKASRLVCGLPATDPASEISL